MNMAFYGVGLEVQVKKLLLQVKMQIQNNPAETSDTRKSSSRGTTPIEKENLILRI